MSMSTCFGMPSFVDKREAFLKDNNARAAAETFESGGDFDSSYIKGSLAPVGPFVSTVPLPIFTHFAKPVSEGGLPSFVKPVIVFKGDDFLILLNDKMPYPEAYESLGKPASLAGMALVHLLAIPKARIYNAVTLNATHKPLLRAMQTAVEVLAQTDRPRLAALVRGTVADVKNGNPEWLETFDTDAGTFVNDTVPRLEFAFHVHSYDAEGGWTGQSVGHLHMHCLLGPRTSFEHDKKNVSLQEVYDAL